jgi:cytoskeletal protein RodZ
MPQPGSTSKGLVVSFSSIANPPKLRLNMAEMPTVAEQLRTAREARKLSITEVAEITKIRGDHIRALEEGNFDVFVAPVYIRGFTRTYATLLRLDVPEIIQTLAAELGQTEKFAEPPPLSKEQKGALDFVMLQLSKVNWQKGAVLLGSLAVIGILVMAVWFWRRQRNADPSAGLPPAVYKPTQRPVGETLPLPAPAPRK